MKRNNRLVKGTLMIALAASAVACSKDDGPDNGRESNEVEFFVAGSQDNKNYLLATPDITSGTLSIKGQGLETAQSYGSWLFPTPYVGIGLSYQKGNPGLGMGVALGAQGNIVKSGGDFQIASRFTTYGTFQEKVVTVVGDISVKGDLENIYSTFNFIDPAANNAVKTVTKNTTNLTGNGETATLSGVVQFGANNFLTALVPSSVVVEDGEVTIGETAYPDSVWIASYDKDLNITKIYGDDRISYAAGRHRSQYKNAISDDGKGNVYVFSPSNDYTTKPAGVIRINSGASEFDDTYYWNLEEAVAKTGADPEIKFKEIHHVAGDYFILDYVRPGNTPTSGTTTANALALVNVVDKTFQWVEGLPDYNFNPTYGTPIAEDGKFYVPTKEADKLPAIYIIDPTTGKATKGLEVDAESISGIGKLRR